MQKLKVLFSEIPEEGVSVEINSQEWFPAEKISKVDDAKVEVFLFKKERHHVLVKGSIDVTLVLDCDRCLDKYNYPVNSKFNINVEYLPKALRAKQPSEHHCSEEDMTVVFVDEAKIDVGALLKEQTNLAVPGKQLCNTNCLGLCSNCGKNLNISSCNCLGVGSNSPFKVLETLKK